MKNKNSFRKDMRDPTNEEKKLVEQEIPNIKGRTILRFAEYVIYSALTGFSVVWFAVEFYYEKTQRQDAWPIVACVFLAALCIFGAIVRWQKSWGNINKLSVGNYNVADGAHVGDDKFVLWVFTDDSMFAVIRAKNSVKKEMCV